MTTSSMDMLTSTTLLEPNSPVAGERPESSADIRNRYYSKLLLNSTARGGRVKTPAIPIARTAPSRTGGVLDNCNVSPIATDNSPTIEIAGAQLGIDCSPPVAIPHAISPVALKPSSRLRAAASGFINIGKRLPSSLPYSTPDPPSSANVRPHHPGNLEDLIPHCREQERGTRGNTVATRTCTGSERVGDHREDQSHGRGAIFESELPELSADTETSDGSEFFEPEISQGPPLKSFDEYFGR